MVLSFLSLCLSGKKKCIFFIKGASTAGWVTSRFIVGNPDDADDVGT